MSSRDLMGYKKIMVHINTQHIFLYNSLTVSSMVVHISIFRLTDIVARVVEVPSSSMLSTKLV